MQDQEFFKRIKEMQDHKLIYFDGISFDFHYLDNFPNGLFQINSNAIYQIYTTKYLKFYSRLETLMGIYSVDEH
jgi:membrane protease subunit (stomatin/prohibitin family)